MTSPHLVTFAVLLVVVGPVPASGLEYPCPSDPGFCYLDTGNDGCFDSGVDEGPIDSQLESGEFPSPLPPGEDLPTDPGSIVCPPSVKKLVVAGPAVALDWRTAVGSDIVLHRTRLDIEVTERVDMRSGGAIRLGGRVETSRSNGAINGGETNLVLVAEGDVVVEASMRNRRYANRGRPHYGVVHLRSLTGDVVIGPRVRLHEAVVLADVGNVSIAERVRLIDHVGGIMRIVAGGDISMASPSVSGFYGGLMVMGANVSLSGRARLLAKKGSTILASGTVSLENVMASAWLTIEGVDVTIGNPLRSSKLRGLSIEASGAVAVQNVRVKAPIVDIVTSGTSIDVLDSRFGGAGDDPSVDLVAALGSTCDLTGSTFKKTTLTASCDTVVGP